MEFMVLFNDLIKGEGDRAKPELRPPNEFPGANPGSDKSEDSKSEPKSRPFSDVRGLGWLSKPFTKEELEFGVFYSQTPSKNCEETNQRQFLYPVSKQINWVILFDESPANHKPEFVISEVKANPVFSVYNLSVNIGSINMFHVILTEEVVYDMNKLLDYLEKIVTRSLMVAASSFNQNCTLGNLMCELNLVFDQHANSLDEDNTLIYALKADLITERDRIAVLNAQCAKLAEEKVNIKAIQTMETSILTDKLNDLRKQYDEVSKLAGKQETELDSATSQVCEQEKEISEQKELIAKQQAEIEKLKANQRPDLEGLTPGALVTWSLDKAHYMQIIAALPINLVAGQVNWG